MPLPTGVVKPVLVTRILVAQASSSDVEDSKLNVLEAFANGTLANTIRQLSSLSKQAEGMFSELIREAHSLTTRVNSLQIKLDRLSIITKEFNSGDDEKVITTLRPIHARDDFKSATVFDNQQVFSRDTMPTRLLGIYSKCDKPPPLYKLNPYREDGQDSMRFYTDPNYFFDLNRFSTSRDLGKITGNREKRRNGPPSEGNGYRRVNKIIKQPYNTRERQKQLAIQNGEYIMSRDDLHYRAACRAYASFNNGLTRQCDYCQCMGNVQGEITSRFGTQGAEFGPLVAHPPSINSYSTVISNHTAIGSGHRSHSNRKKLPPSPPLPSIENNLHIAEPPLLPSSTPAAELSNSSSSISSNIPPAPPLPPAFDPSVICANTFSIKRPSSPIKSIPSHLTHFEPSIPPAGYNNARQLNDNIIIDNEMTTNIRSGIARNTQTTDHFNLHVDLLKAIKNGVELRKVDSNEQKEKKRNDTFRGVDLILSRRVAVQISDSDSSSSNEYDSDSWVEEISSYTFTNCRSETPRKL